MKEKTMTYINPKRLISLIITVTLIFTLLPTTINASEATARTITVFEVEGNDVRMSKGTARDFPARADMKLHDGYTLATGNDSFATLLLDDGSLLKMDRNSKIQISRTANNRLSVSVLSGGLVVDAVTQTGNNAVEIRTGNSALAVRGTFFIAEFRQDGTARFTMFEGSGEVDGVTLPAGHIMVVTDSTLTPTGDSQYTVTQITMDDETSELVLRTILDNVERFIETGIIEEEDLFIIEELLEHIEEERLLAEETAATFIQRLLEQIINFADIGTETEIETATDTNVESNINVTNNVNETDNRPPNNQGNNNPGNNPGSNNPPDQTPNQTPNLTGLRSAIDRGNGLFDSVEISINGNDVPSNRYWATITAHTTLRMAINDANNVLNNTSQHTTTTINTQISLLNTAIATFEQGVRQGTQGTGTGTGNPVARVNGSTDEFTSLADAILFIEDNFSPTAPSIYDRITLFADTVITEFVPGITHQGHGFTIAIESGATLTIDDCTLVINFFDINAGGELIVLNDGFLYVTDAMYNYGDVNVNANGIIMTLGLTNNGDITIDGNDGMVTIATDGIFENGVENDATVTIRNGGRLNAINADGFYNFEMGTIEVEVGGFLHFGSISTSTNMGKISVNGGVAGGGIVNPNVTIRNIGKLDVLGGSTLAVSTLLNEGEVLVSGANTFLNVVSEFVNADGIIAPDTATLTINNGGEMIMPSLYNHVNGIITVGTNGSIRPGINSLFINEGHIEVRAQSRLNIGGNNQGNLNSGTITIHGNTDPMETGGLRYGMLSGSSSARITFTADAAHGMMDNATYPLNHRFYDATGAVIAGAFIPAGTYEWNATLGSGFGGWQREAANVASIGTHNFTSLADAFQFIEDRFLTDGYDEITLTANTVVTTAIPAITHQDYGFWLTVNDGVTLTIENAGELYIDFLEIEENGILTVQNNGVLDADVMYNDGAVNVNTNGTIITGAIENNGVIIIDGSGAVVEAEDDFFNGEISIGIVTIRNGGVLDTSGALDIRNFAMGTINVESSGRLNCLGLEVFINAGIISIYGNASPALSGEIWCDIDITGTGVIEITNAPLPLADSAGANPGTGSFFGTPIPFFVDGVRVTTSPIPMGEYEYSDVAPMGWHRIP
jgi:hypothetical protein